MTLSTAQVDALLSPLDAKRVKSKQGQSHLEAWDVRRHLIRVFGWGGWSFEVVKVDCILERSVWESDQPNATHKGRHTVAYRVIGRLTIFDPDTHAVLATFEDGATGDAQNQPGFADAHDMALKTGMSQALKRCAVNLGDRFGLSLYNKGTSGAVVGKSVAHAASVEHAASEEVTGGELDDDEPKPAPLAGWSTLEDQAEAHAGLAAEIRAEPEAVQEQMRSYRQSKGLTWPMPRDDFDGLCARLIDVRAVEFGGGRDGGDASIREGEAATTGAGQPPPSSRQTRAAQVASDSSVGSLSKAQEIAAKHGRREPDPKERAAGVGADA